MGKSNGGCRQINRQFGTLNGAQDSDLCVHSQAVVLSVVLPAIFKRSLHLRNLRCSPTVNMCNCCF